MHYRLGGRIIRNTRITGRFGASARIRPQRLRFTTVSRTAAGSVGLHRWNYTRISQSDETRYSGYKNYYFLLSLFREYLKIDIINCLVSSLVGTVNSVTKLASSVARNLDRLTLDEEHLQRQEESRRMRPQGMAQGLYQGLTGLGMNLLGSHSFLFRL